MIFRSLLALILIGVQISGGVSSHANAQAQPTRTYWNHNGSILYLVADGAKREFYYEKPRAEMLEAGATQGSLLFSGKAIKENYSGKAYIYNSRCGKISYEVSGPILDNYERVVLQGQAPKVGADCRTRGYLKDTLEFTLLKPERRTQQAQLLSKPPLVIPSMANVGGFRKKNKLACWPGHNRKSKKSLKARATPVAN